MLAGGSQFGPALAGAFHFGFRVDGTETQLPRHSHERRELPQTLERRRARLFASPTFGGQLETTLPFEDLFAIHDTSFYKAHVQPQTAWEQGKGRIENPSYGRTAPRKPRMYGTTSNFSARNVKYPKNAHAQTRATNRTGLIDRLRDRILLFMYSRINE